MTIPDEIINIIQVARMCELSEDAVSTLTKTYADSGLRMDFAGLRTADIPSTGGPSSLSTLLSPLMLTLAGYKVPKLAVPGRPAGGIDALAQVQGYRVKLTPAEISEIINTSGYAHFISGNEIAPLDAATFQLRKEIEAIAVPDPAGVRLLAEPRLKVERGEPVMSIRMPDSAWMKYEKTLMDAISITDTPALPQPDRIVHG